jgi:hypothetical protein
MPRPKPRSPLPLTSFYDTPHLTAGEPGELIRSVRFDDYDLPRVVATRILYHSRSARADDVATSGVVLTPPGSPPNGGWPLIAWAHPFSGVGRVCAPSLARNLDYGPVFSMWISLGYAVVATDYTGLGTDFAYAGIDVRSNAQDVVNSVKAARLAVPSLGAKWVALGDSEGAAAVVALNETLHESNFLGSVALSGVVDPGQIYERVGRADSRGLWLIHSVKAVHPHFELHEVLTERGLSFYQQMGNSCEIPNNSWQDLLKAGWVNTELVRTFFEQNRLGGTRAAAPMLVIAGGSDREFPINLVSSAVTRLCQAGDRVQFDHYPGLNREQIPGETVTEQTSWIRERFAGKPAPGNCP